MESNIYNKDKKDSTSDSDNDSSSITNLKKLHDPLYYYYIIGGKKYKYTNKKKNIKFMLTFIFSDSSCPAGAKYNKLKIHLHLLQ